jgi:hypothetical protein
MLVYYEKYTKILYKKNYYVNYDDRYYIININLFIYLYEY